MYIRFPWNTGVLRNFSSVFLATSLYSRPGSRTSVMPSSELIEDEPAGNGDDRVDLATAERQSFLIDQFARPGLDDAEDTHGVEAIDQALVIDGRGEPVAPSGQPGLPDRLGLGDGQVNRETHRSRLIADEIDNAVMEQGRVGAGRAQLVGQDDAVGHADQQAIGVNRHVDVADPCVDGGTVVWRQFGTPRFGAVLDVQGH